MGEKPVRKKKKFILWLILVCYVVVSMLVIQYDRSYDKYGWYNLSSTIESNSVPISTEPEYAQYFYAPVRADGIAIQFGTFEKRIKGTITVSIYDGNTDELVGTTTLSRRDVKDNEFAKALFDGFYLEEGGYYYVEFTIDNTEDTVCCWMGEPDSDYLDSLYYGGELQKKSCIRMELLYYYNGAGLFAWILITAGVMAFSILYIHRERKGESGKITAGEVVYLILFITAACAIMVYYGMYISRW